MIRINICMRSIRRLHNKRKKMMNQNVRDYIILKVNELMQAPFCCSEAKAAAQSWLDAVGTENEADQTRKLIAELELDVMPVEGMIAFTESAAAAQLLGKGLVRQLASHARELKGAGTDYCDCPACMAAAAILDKKEELF